MTYEDEEYERVEGKSNVMILLEKRLKSKLDYLSTKFTKSEIGGFLTYKELRQDEDKNVTIVLDDLLIPPQKATTGEVEIDNKGQVEMLKEYGVERCGKIVGHWHSHHIMDTFFSSDDEKVMKDFSEHKTFCIFIVSSEGKHKVRLVLKNMFKDIPIELKIDNVEYETEFDEDIVKEMEEEIKKKVQEPEVVVKDVSIKYTTKSKTDEVKQVKKDIESRIKYYHINNQVKVERIYKYYANLIETEFKTLNPIVSVSPQEKDHYDVVVELGDRNKAKEFMVDVKAFLMKTILLEREKAEAEKEDGIYEYLDEETEDRYLSELEKEEMEELEEEMAREGYSGRCDYNNYRDRERRIMEHRYSYPAYSGYIDYRDF